MSMDCISWVFESQAPKDLGPKNRQWQFHCLRRGMRWQCHVSLELTIKIDGTCRCRCDMIKNYHYLIAIYAEHSSRSFYYHQDFSSNLQILRAYFDFTVKLNYVNTEVCILFQALILSFFPCSGKRNTSSSTVV